MGWVLTGTFVTPASGTTVITTTSKGSNAKGILLWATHNTSNDTAQVETVDMHGMSDGTNDRAGMAFAGQAVNNTHRASHETACIYMFNPVSETATIVGTAEMNVNDVTITYSTFESGVIIHYVIFGGIGVSAFVTSENANTSPVSGVGFQPTLLFASSDGAAAGSSSEQAFLSLGCSDGTDDWTCLTYRGDDARDNMGSVLIADHLAGQRAAEFTPWEMGSIVFNSDGFSHDNPNADSVRYLFLRFENESCKVGKFTKSTASAPVSQSFSPGFIPQAYGMASCNNTSDSNAAGDENCILAFGCYDGTTQHCTLTTTELNDNTDAHQRSNDAEFLELSDDIDTDGVQSSATAQAITDSTPEVEWDPNAASAVHIGYWAIEEILTPEQEGFQFRQDDDSESGATNIDAQDANMTAIREVSRRLRIATDYIGDPPTTQLKLQFRKVGDADSEWEDIS